MIKISNLSFRYGSKIALDNVSLDVREREIFGLLGPNGGGKTTLFRILSTLVRPMEGNVTVFDLDIVRQAALIRADTGVVFQSPSLDKKLTVLENATHQGHLYGMRGQSLRKRIDELMDRFQLRDKANEYVEKLSGGMQRRVEIVKALLPQPKLLLMDEPSTGLDPRARMDLSALLLELRDSYGVTVILTTHIMEEAEKCDRIAILHLGKISAIGTPADLKREIEGDVIALQVKNPATLAREIEKRFQISVQVADGGIRIEKKDGHHLINSLMDAFPDEITEMSMRKPTLEDVFLHKTGAAFEYESR